TRPSSCATRSTSSRLREAEHLRAERLHRAERVLGVVGLLDLRLAAGELVDHHAFLHQHQAAEFPARGMRLALEAEKIEPEVAVTFLVDELLIDLVAAAQDLRA